MNQYEEENWIDYFGYYVGVCVEIWDITALFKAQITVCTKL